MTATLTVAGVDVSAVAPWDVAVQAGRDDLDSQPDATVLDATIHGWRPAGQLGDPVTLADAEGMLFHGTLTDLVTHLEPDTRQVWTTRLTATGPLADIGRTIIGDQPWPQESDAARIARIIDLTGYRHTINQAVGGPQILARDVDRQPALAVAQETAADALGVLWEDPADPTTPIRYTPQRLRVWEPVPLAWSELPPTQTWADLPPTMTWDAWKSDQTGDDALTGANLDLDAGQVLADIELAQQVGDLIRRVRVVYGPTPADDSPRPEVVLGSDTPEVSRDTQLADNTGATQVADALWRARREPGWRLRSATLLLHTLPTVDRQRIRDALTIGTRVTIDHIDFDSPTGPVWQGYLEGWTHELADAGHRLTLQLVERRLVEPAQRWQDLDPALAWQDITPTLTWGETAGGVA